MEIGENFSAGHNVIIDPNDSFGIIIGNNVGIASGTFIRAANHGYSDPDMPFKEQGHIARKLVSCDGCEASIIIEDDVWIGANSTILSGAHIKKGSIVSAGSVTSFKLPEYSIAVGNPARVIASRRNTNFSKKNYRFK